MLINCAVYAEGKRAETLDLNTLDRATPSTAREPVMAASSGWRSRMQHRKRLHAFSGISGCTPSRSKMR